VIRKIAYIAIPSLHAFMESVGQYPHLSLWKVACALSQVERDYISRLPGCRFG
jgi:hypothetical protein